MDGGSSKQYHVLVSAKRTIKPVQGCTGLTWILTYGRNSFCGEEWVFNAVAPFNFLIAH